MKKDINILFQSAAGDAPAVRGKWFNIRLQPDLATGERINVGVGFQDDHGQIHLRMLDRFERLRCLYDSKIEEQTRFLVNTVKLGSDSLLDETPSPNIITSELKPAQGQSVDNILRDLYDTTVTVGKVRRDTSMQDAFGDNTTSKVRQQVFEIIRTRMDIDAERLIAEKEQLPVKDQSGAAHTLDIPIRTESGGYGSIISAWYKTAPSIELHLLRALLQIETAGQIHNKNKLAIFVARPSEDAVTRKIYNTADKAIENIYWQVRKNNIGMEVEESAENLADRIIQWDRAA